MFAKTFLLVLLALPAQAQDASGLLTTRPPSPLLEARPGVQDPLAQQRFRRAQRQSEARQREWAGAVRPEYRRRLERNGSAAANAWLRNEAERFDAQNDIRLKDTLR
ncbi:hypothetical protein QCN27_07330 [Cereibacter sp. SYSU M97828]|nr:hypothetical protein [Cereibacter flavus]